MIDEKINEIIQNWNLIQKYFKIINIIFNSINFDHNQNKTFFKEYLIIFMDNVNINLLLLHNYYQAKIHQIFFSI